MFRIDLRLFSNKYSQLLNWKSNSELFIPHMILSMFIMNIWFKSVCDLDKFYLISRLTNIIVKDALSCHLIKRCICQGISACTVIFFLRNALFAKYLIQFSQNIDSVSDYHFKFLNCANTVGSTAIKFVFCKGGSLGYIKKCTNTHMFNFNIYRCNKRLTFLHDRNTYELSRE